jgi:glycosyltransferase A (GT-A) superfamily protein (DUF2064 family)
MNRGNNICILAKTPRPGEVKAKLEYCLEAAQSALLARALLFDTISVALRIPRCNVTLAFRPADALGEISELLNQFKNAEMNKAIKAKAEGVLLLPQIGVNPGELIGGAVRHLFDEGARKLLLVCADNPLLDPVVLRAALELLKRHDAVLGPTFDGGFYLIGLNKHQPGLFEELDWTPGEIYKNLQERLNREGLNWLELEIAYDVDGPEDLDQLCCDLRILRMAGRNDICRHTENCLSQIGR